MALPLSCNNRRSRGWSDERTRGSEVRKSRREGERKLRSKEDD